MCVCVYMCACCRGPFLELSARSCEAAGACVCLCVCVCVCVCVGASKCVHARVFLSVCTYTCMFV